MKDRKKVLVISYSQAGQTRQAVESFLSGFQRVNDVDVVRVELEDQKRFSMPWGLFNFVKAMPEILQSVDRDTTTAAKMSFGTCALVVLAYPVWYLSPALPVTNFLDSLDDGILDGVPVITITTCRNMWVEAQRQMRAVVAKKGGRLMAHAVLVDRAPVYASLITTPRFFLTGKKGFTSPFLRKVFPDFGIDQDDFSGLRIWG